MTVAARKPAIDRAERVIAFISEFCRVPEGEHIGQPIELAPFQQDFIRDLYNNPAGTRRAYLSIARKNGKSGLIACILLAHIVGPEALPNTQIVSGAQSRDQAALVFDLARKMIDLEPRLSAVVRIVPSGKRLIGLPRNVEYKALSAEGKTAHGLSPVLAILDEVGQVEGPTNAFVDAITTSQGAHKSPLLIAISTQAPTDADLLSVWIDDAEKSADPRIVSHVYAADPDADVTDEAAWQAANPALGLFRSMDDLKEQAIQAHRMPSFEPTFRNLCLNQRVAANATFVSPNIWKDNAGEPQPMRTLYGGLDLSETNDLTALVLVSPDAGWSVKATFWLPGEGLEHRARSDRVPYDVWRDQGFLTTTPGKSVEYEYVAQYLYELVSSERVKRIAFDRWNMRHLRPWLIKAGLPESKIDEVFLDFGQGFQSMGPALRTLESLLLNGKLKHGGNPILTMCAANAVVTTDPAGGRKLDKKKSRGRIDGLVSLAMACAVANEDQYENKVFPVDLAKILE